MKYLEKSLTFINELAMLDLRESEVKGKCKQ